MIVLVVMDFLKMDLNVKNVTKLCVQNVLELQLIAHLFVILIALLVMLPDYVHHAL